jgi:hypothetical protein
MTTAITSTKAPATKAPAKAPAKVAPAKVAPAKKAASTAASKITWKRDGEPDAKGQAPAVGTAGERTYRITVEGGVWSATVKVGSGKPTVLVADAKTGHLAWAACVKHNKSAA